MMPYANCSISYLCYGEGEGRGGGLAHNILSRYPLRGATVWLTRRLDQPPTPSRASMGMRELLASSCTIKGSVARNGYF
jgi:hypothetical protein